MSIYLFGDSITDFGTAANSPRFLESKDTGPGWSDLLREAFSRRADVINRGFVGYNTKWFLEQGCHTLFSQNLGEPLFCVLMITNDTADPSKNPNNQGVPLEDYAANLQTIIKGLLKACSRVILCSPPPIHREKYIAWRQAMPSSAGATVEALEDRTAERNGIYAAEAAKVAKELQVPFVDTFNAFGGVAVDPALLSDGLHLSSKGDQLMLRLVLDCVNNTFPELRVQPDDRGGFAGSSSRSELPPKAPWWDLIDAANPASSFQAPRPNTFQWPVKSQPQMLLLGDSITQLSFKSPLWKGEAGGPGWGDLLQARFCHRADVISRGLSGYNSTWGRHAWDQLNLDSFQDLTLGVVFFGANDASTLSQNVTLTDFAANIRHLTEKLLARTGRVVVIGTAPISREKYLVWRRSKASELKDKPDEDCMDRSCERSQQYSLAAQRVVEEINNNNNNENNNNKRVQFLDLMSLFGSPPNADNFEDGLHLSSQGNRALFEALYALLTAAWPELAVETPNFFCSLQSKSSTPLDRPTFQELGTASSSSSAEAASSNASSTPDANNASAAGVVSPAKKQKVAGE